VNGAVCRILRGRRRVWVGARRVGSSVVREISWDADIHVGACVNNK
jgi:hypothetical protein